MKKTFISLFAVLYLFMIPAANNPGSVTRPGIVYCSFSCMHEYGYHTVYVLNHEKHLQSRIRNTSGKTNIVYKRGIYHE